MQDLLDQIATSDMRHLTELKKLRQENTMLKDHNKHLEDRNLVSDIVSRETNNLSGLD